MGKMGKMFFSNEFKLVPKKKRIGKKKEPAVKYAYAHGLEVFFFK